jgi:hypothetical protein
MKCSECPVWQPSKFNNYAFGYCKAKGHIRPPQKTIAEVDGFYKEEVTRNKKKTRPWHICDVIFDDEEEEKVAPKKPAGKKPSGKKKPEREVWTTRQTLDEAMEEVRQQGVPIPKAIDGLDEEDVFPSTNDMEFSELGKLLFKYEALKGYVAWLAKVTKIEFKNTVNGKNLLLKKEVNRIEKASEKKRLKDSMEAQAMEDNVNIGALAKKEASLEAKLIMYEGLFEIYSGHWDTVSREISRMQDEHKTNMYAGGK